MGELSLAEYEASGEPVEVLSRGREEGGGRSARTPLIWLGACSQRCLCHFWTKEVSHSISYSLQYADHPDTPFDVFHEDISKRLVNIAT